MRAWKGNREWDARYFLCSVSKRATATMQLSTSNHAHNSFVWPLSQRRAGLQKGWHARSFLCFLIKHVHRWVKNFTSRAL